jgi:hypothetical protein
VAITSRGVELSSTASCAASPSSAMLRGERGVAAEAAAVVASGELQSCVLTAVAVGESGDELLSKALGFILGFAVRVSHCPPMPRTRCVVGA